MKKITTRTVEMTLDEENILHIKPHNGVELELEDAEQNVLAIRKLTGGKKCCVLIDGNSSVNASREARAFAASKTVSKYRIAEAIVANSMVKRLATKIYINFNKPHNPTRIFNNSAEALLWLKSFSPLSVEATQKNRHAELVHS